MNIQKRIRHIANQFEGASDLYNLVHDNQSPGMVVVEIGVAFGETAKHWLPIVEANRGVGILVDNFCGGPGFGTDYNNGPLEDMRATIANIIAPYPRTLVLEGVSWEMEALILNKSVDIVFIDADHRYSSVVKDITAWAPKVKNGGILSGHDCNNCIGNYDITLIEKDWDSGKHHGVVKAVSEMLNDVEIINDSTWFTRNTNINKEYENRIPN